MANNPQNANLNPSEIAHFAGEAYPPIGPDFPFPMGGLITGQPLYPMISFLCSTFQTETLGRIERMSVCVCFSLINLQRDKYFET